MDKLKYIFIVLYVICSGSLSSQTYEPGGELRLNNLPKIRESCFLELLNERQYCLSYLVEHEDVDIVREMLVSYGTVHKVGKCII